MKTNHFRDDVLGPWSSHPHWMRWRQKWFARAAFVPFLAVLLLGVLTASRLDQWTSLVRNASWWLTALAATLAFGLGATITLSLCSRLAAWRITVSSREAQAERMPLDPWLFLLALFLGAVLPFAMVQSQMVPEAIRFAFQFFALFPLAALLLALRILPRADAGQGGAHPSAGEGVVVERRAWWLLLIPIAGVLGLTLLEDIGRLAGRDDLRGLANRWLPWYAPMGIAFLGTLVLLPLAFVVFAAWRTSGRLAPRRMAPLNPPVAAAAGARPSLGSRFVGWVKRLLGRTDQLPPSEPRPPEWLGELFAAINQEGGAAELIELGEHETSPYDDQTDLRHVFGVASPTVDQVKLFKRFVDYYESQIRAGASASGISSDLLVHGNPGSGKTTALLACAVYAAFVRGQRVLYIVPDSLRRDAAVERIEGFLRDLRLDFYLHAAALSDESVDQWLTGDGLVPQIVVGTVRTVEELYGHPCSRERLPRLRRLAVLPEVVIVDDFTDFADAERSHLPFLLDKHRLLLATECLTMQSVVSCRKLSELGEEVLGQRLFTVRRLNREDNVFWMRPRRGARAWRVRLETENATAMVDRLVVWCLRYGLDVVLYRLGIDEGERTAQESRFAAQGGPGHLAILSDLERPLGAPSRVDVDAIFYNEALQNDVCLALRLHAGNDETVIFNIVTQGTFTPPGNDGTVPVVADRASMPLLAAHLNSVSRMFHPGSPVPAEIWIQCGINPANVPVIEPGIQREGAALSIDQWDEPDYRGCVWSYLVTHGTYDRNPVHVGGFPEARRSLYRTLAADRLMVGKPTTLPVGNGQIGGLQPASRQAVQARRAQWVDEGANFGEAGEVDLAHAYELKLAWGRRSLALRAIEQHTGGQITLSGESWHGSGIDRYLPVCSLAWDVPAGLRGEKFWGGPDDGLRWLQLCGAVELVKVETQIVGQMSELAEMTDSPPVAFDYAATLSALVIQPAPLAQDALAAMADCLRGRWATAGDTRFRPALTAALNYGLRTKLFGFPYFAKVLAFEPSGEAANVGAAVAWVVEPHSSGRTAAGAIATLLGHPAGRRELLQAMTAFLSQLSQAQIKPQRFLRRVTRTGYLGDETDAKTNEALALVRSVPGG